MIKEHGTIDIVVGGFPAKPFSRVAGARKGTDDNRHLLAGNVSRSSKSLSRGGLLEKMCEVLLASKTAWSSRMCALTWKEKIAKSGRSIFQSAGVGAPHRRERMRIVAHSRCTLRQGGEGTRKENANESKQENADQYQRSSSTSTDNVADTYTKAQQRISRESTVREANL